MTDPDFIAALVRERFGPPTPKPPKPDRVSAAAIRELVAELHGAEDEQEAAS